MKAHVWNKFYFSKKNFSTHLAAYLVALKKLCLSLYESTGLFESVVEYMGTFSCTMECPKRNAAVAKELRTEGSTPGK